ncbi:hypothetical protein KFK09_008731 [Dendrobium nobile]|uniref:Uncharacterized protein n=1 Tax=Dendrobium nobile TaxID=94219 RepID=A0A8T3BNK5_DENNO|nr:hypothetical protein KFK09_008731 [Dendrobium nobile]
MNNMEDDENTSPSSDLQLHELQVPVQPQGSHKLSKDILLSDAMIDLDNIPSEFNPNIDDHLSNLFVPSANEPSNFSQVCTENDVIPCRDVASSGLVHAGMDCNASRKTRTSCS